MKQFLLFVLIFLGVMFLWGCNKSINIVSDEPDAAFIAEAYNQYKNKDNIMVYSIDDLAKVVNESNIDFIITQSTTDSLLLNEMSFTKIKKRSREINKPKENFKLISFSLPLIVVKKEFDNNLFHSSLIDISQIQDVQKVVAQKNGVYSLVFYPIDSSFSDVFGGAQQEMDWFNQMETGTDMDVIRTYFSDHYGPAPMSARLLDNNITYKYVASNIFFAMPYYVQSQFNIYLLRNATNKIPVISPVYIGQQSNGIVGLVQRRRFLKWLLSEKGQRQIISYKQNYQNKKPVSFIGGTLSAIWNINTSLLFNQNRWLFETQPLFSQIAQ